MALIVAIQCHPERLLTEDWAKKFFKEFVEAAKG